jgi:iron complex transport system substrate-binding protein
MKIFSKGRLLAVAVAAVIAVSGAVFATGCSGSANSGGSASGSTSAVSNATRTVTDAAGRQVDIPSVDNLKSIYSTSPIAQMYLFSLAPQLAGGTNSTYTDAELKYLPEGTADLPNYGTWAMNGTLDNEAIMAAGVQLLLDVTSAPITDSDISAANDLQDQTGIPVLLFDGSVDKTPDTYRAIGEVLGTEDRANDLASYCEKAYSDVTAAIAKVPDSQKVSVYYAEGPDGLKTEPQNSPHFTTFATAGAKDAAQCDMTKGSGMTQVSLENVIAWNPQVIIAWSSQYQGGAADTIRTSSDWASVSAVQNGKVYTIPALPYMWGDRPPSVTRYIGMQWLANKLYPTYYDIDMVKTTQDFYKLFFSVDLTDDQAKDILDCK